MVLKSFSAVGGVLPLYVCILKIYREQKKIFFWNPLKIHDFFRFFFGDQKIEKCENFRLSKKCSKTVQKDAGYPMQLFAALLPHVNHSKWSCFQIWTISVVESYLRVHAEKSLFSKFLEWNFFFSKRNFTYWAFLKRYSHDQISQTSKIENLAGVVCEKNGSDVL